MKSGKTVAALVVLVLGYLMTAGSTLGQELSPNRGPIVPQVQQQMQGIQDNSMISVIVELKDQDDLHDVKEHERRKRLRTVVSRLKRKSSLSQRRIQVLLRRRALQGQVSTFTSFWVFNGLEVTATAAVIQELGALSEVATIVPNSSVSAPLFPASGNPPEANLALVNAPTLWNLGWQGQGVVVANMDTGVDVDHPDLINKWRGGTNSWFDPYGEHPDRPVDQAGSSSGHGTWTMGVMVSGDASGTSIGMAPAAQWIAVKIFNDQGVGTVAGIHAGFQWLLDPDDDPATDDAPHVVNNSWTYQALGCNLEFATDLQSLRAAGILPIFAAGNSGPNAGTSVSPANNPGAFAVGGVDNNDLLYAYSSRGPTTCSGERIYPHVVAPGVNILSTDRAGLYTNVTGTSLAAPHVSGALALLLSAFPNLTVTEQELALINGAVDLGDLGADNTFGYGRLDVWNSYQWLSATAANQPPVVNAGVDGLVTLSAAAQLSGTVSDDGLPAPANLVTSWSQVSGPGTVSFGDATALVTTAAFDTTGNFTLRLTANDGALSSSDDVTITVDPAPPVNQAPVVNAGLDETVTLPATAQLNGAASDDGLPTPAMLTTTWSVVSGPGAVTFGDANARQTTVSFDTPGSYTLRLTANDGALSSTDDVVVTVEPPVNQAPPVTNEILYLSSSANGRVGSIRFRDEDIIAYNPTTELWSLVLDGSDVGLGGVDIDAFAILSDGTFLLSVDKTVNLKGVGSVKDTDIVHFAPTSLGPITAGDFSMYLRGADMELTRGSEDIDAITFLADGRLLISTLGNARMLGVSSKDEDLIALDLTTHTASLYFDGSAVDLSASSEDVWGAWVDGAGNLFLSTMGTVTVDGLKGRGSDVLACEGLTSGLNTTNCSFRVYWQGANHGFNRIIDGFAIAGDLPLFIPAAQVDVFAAAEDNEVELDDDPLNGDQEIDDSDVTVTDEEAELTPRVFVPLVIR